MSSKNPITLKVQGADAVERAMTGIRRGLDPALMKSVSEMVDTGKDKIRNKAPKAGQKPWTTGKFRENIKTRLSGLTGEIYSDFFYAWFIERATKPHWIGSAVLIRGVGWRFIGMHKGTQAQPMFEPTGEELKRDAPNIVRRHITDLLSRHSTRGAGNK